MKEQPILDTEALQVKARNNWLKSRKRQRSLLDIIDGTVHWWLVIIAFTVFFLSAPHTTSIFNLVTPGWGWLAPAGVELGLLFVAFRRKQAQQRDEKIEHTFEILEVIAFIIAIIVNGAGALDNIVSSVGIQNLSFETIKEKFGTMPAVAQVSLFIVLLFAFFIPITTRVVGEGLANLIYEREHKKDTTEDEWQEAKYQEYYTVLFHAYMNQGASPAYAQRWATATAQRLTVSSVLPVLSVQTRPDKKRDTAEQMMISDPSLAALSLRDLQKKTGISKDTWAIVKQNGRNHEASNAGSGPADP